MKLLDWSCLTISSLRNCFTNEPRNWLLTHDSRQVRDGVTAWPTDALRTCKLLVVATKVRKKIVATRVGETFGVTFVAPFVAPDRALFLQPTCQPATRRVK